MTCIKLSIACSAIAVAAVALVFPVVAYDSPIGAERAGAPAVGAAGVALPTAPDFEIYDPHPPGLYERRADVAYNPDRDEYLVVFDFDPTAGDYDVRGIFVSGDGVPAGSPISIAEETSFIDAHPAVAYSPDTGSYLVVWQRSHVAESYDAIVGAVVTETAGAPLTIHWTLHGDQLHPDVAYASGPQQYLVAWESHEPYTLPPDILGATVDPTGTNIGPIIAVSPDASSPGQQTYPAVAACATTGRWLVAWQDTRNQGTTGNDIYAQQVVYTGPGSSLWGSAVSVGTLVGEARAPAVDWGPVDEGDGEFLVVWIEWQMEDIAYARQVRPDSSLVGEAIVVCDTHGVKSSPDVVYSSGSNDWWVAWESG
ncbi:MAG: hypothetical protein PVH41_02470 [Anaerolineae bacterium]|jgi:hypothetical protein